MIPAVPALGNAIERERQALQAQLKLLCQRLRQAREELGLSLEGSADRLGVDANTVWRYEAGRVVIPLGRLLHLAQIYRRPPAWFLDGGEEWAASGYDSTIEVESMPREVAAEVRELLREAMPFRYLTNEEIEGLSQYAERRSFGRGEPIGASGIAEGGVYIIAQGAIGCFIRLDQEGHPPELELATLKRPDCIVRVVRPVLAIFFRAKEPTEVLYIASSLISTLGKDDPFLLERLSQGLARYFAAISRFFAQQMTTLRRLGEK